jgi:hypothetical protein
MQRQNQEVSVASYGGGLATVKKQTTLAADEFAVMDNVVVLPGGAGFRSRNGNSKFNSTVMEGGLAGNGIGYYKNAGVEYLYVTINGKIYVSSALSGTMTDISGGLTLSTVETERFTMFQFDDIMIGVGGAPNAPWYSSAGGTAALLGGSPPSGDFGFAYNNRAFIGVASTSTLYWGILNNAQDWTGSGSGSVEIQGGDGDQLVVALPLNINTILALKQNSVHVVTGRTSPFPTFPLFKGSGCVGKHAAIVADGLAYWITPQNTMVISDGSRVYDEKDVPALYNVEDLWSSMLSLQNIQVVRRQGRDFDWLIFSGRKNAGTRNDYAIIWDLVNKCWLTCSTGFAANGFTSTQTGTVYMLGYDGYVYKIDATEVYADASASGAPVTWTLESDWLTRGGSLVNAVKVDRLSIAYEARETGTMGYSYAYDFRPLGTTNTFSIVTEGALWDAGLWDAGVWGTFTGKIANKNILGRGDVFKYRLTGSSETQYSVYRTSLLGRDNTQKNFGAN